MAFRRIAILEPSLVYPQPLAASKAPVWQAATDQWLAQALSKGAEAIYARFHSQLPTEVLIVQRLLARSPARILAPAWMASQIGGSCGLHFRSNELLLRTADMSFSPIGQSCHTNSEAQAAQANGADYIFASPIFPTRTHPEAKPIGLEGLRDICAAVSIPVYALGGLDPDREDACRMAGASGIAGIRMFFA